MNDVYRAFRDRDATAPSDAQASLRLLERVTGRTTDELNAQFGVWFLKLRY